MVFVLLDFFWISHPLPVEPENSLTTVFIAILAGQPNGLLPQVLLLQRIFQLVLEAYVLVQRLHQLFHKFLAARNTEVLALSSSDSKKDIIVICNFQK